METDYRTAVTRFQLDAGEHFVKPVKAKCHYSRGAWYLLNRRGEIVCIAGPDACLWGARLAYYHSELGRGNAA